MEALKKTIGELRWITLAGILVSIYLLVLHFNYDTLGTTCEIGGIFSCSVLLIKKYALWFGIPVPVFSLILYVLSFGLSQHAFINHERMPSRSSLYLDLLSFLALGASVCMAWIAFVMLKTVCVFCTVLYIISVLFFLWTHRVRKTVYEDWLGSFVSEMTHFYKNPATLKVIGAGGLMLGGLFFYFQSLDARSNIGLEQFKSTVGRSIGNPDAKLKVEVFSDFQCPSCRMAIAFLYELEKKYQNDMVMTYKFYPLDSSCNRDMRRNVHPQACQAAKAAFCAGVQNQFWAYHDFLFQNQSRLDDGLYQKIAQQKGLKVTPFMDCLKSKVAEDVIQEDLSAGRAYEITGTPTIVVNGKIYSGKRDVEAFDLFVKALN